MNQHGPGGAAGTVSVVDLRDPVVTATVKVATAPSGCIGSMCRPVDGRKSPTFSDLAVWNGAPGASPTRRAP